MINTHLVPLKNASFTQPKNFSTISLQQVLPEQSWVCILQDNYKFYTLKNDNIIKTKKLPHSVCNIHIWLSY